MNTFERHWYYTPTEDEAHDEDMVRQSEDMDDLRSSHAEAVRQLEYFSGRIKSQLPPTIPWGFVKLYAEWFHERELSRQRLARKGWTVGDA